MENWKCHINWWFQTLRKHRCVLYNLKAWLAQLNIIWRNLLDPQIMFSKRWAVIHSILQMYSIWKNLNASFMDMSTDNSLLVSSWKELRFQDVNALLNNIPKSRIPLLWILYQAWSGEKNNWLCFPRIILGFLIQKVSFRKFVSSELTLFWRNSRTSLKFTV